MSALPCADCDGDCGTKPAPPSELPAAGAVAPSESKPIICGFEAEASISWHWRALTA